MGARRVAGDGIVADANARAVLGNFTTGLRRRVSARRAGLLDRLSAFRLARIVCRRSAAGISRDLHSRSCSRIPSVGTRPSPAEAAVEDVDLHQATRRLIHLRRATDDCFQLHVTWNARFVRDLFAKAARLQRRPDIEDRNRLRDRDDLRRDCYRSFIATLRPTPSHYSGYNLWNALDPALDLLANN